MNVLLGLLSQLSKGTDHDEEICVDSGTKLVEACELWTNPCEASMEQNSALHMWELELFVWYPVVGPGSLPGT